jgi:hydrogenase large subunit
MVAYLGGGDPAHVAALDEALGRLRLRPEHLASVMGRHLARAVETAVLADAMADWVLQIKLDQPVCVPHHIPEQADGMGLWDAARGALGHWISIRGGKIASYQAVVPTTWNASPRDDRGQPGPIELALVGAPVPDAKNPFAVGRIVRSFDPCIACAVHLIEPGGRLLAKVRVV